MTRDVDELLTIEGLRRFKEQALGRGWLERFPGKGVRDTDKNVPVDIGRVAAVPVPGLLAAERAVHRDARAGARLACRARTGRGQRHDAARRRSSPDVAIDSETAPFEVTMLLDEFQARALAKASAPPDRYLPW